jgi:NAD+ synthase
MLYLLIFILALKYLPTNYKNRDAFKLKLTSSILNLDLFEVEKKITRFITEYVSNSQAEGVILGLSGGVDSATVAALCSKALGNKNVLALLIPEGETRNQKDIHDAKIIANQFSIETQTIDITHALEGIYTTIPAYDPRKQKCKGNIKARMRMIILYYYANKLNKIVCGGTDKSEALMGYFTKWGDIAADISPIRDLYKTQVRKLAINLGIPEEIALKPSTPALWPNQAAEEELGIKYETLDLILYGLEKFMPINDIANQLNIEQITIETIKNRLLYNEHKRQMPIAPKLSF